jgi:hypothetical protein
MGEVNCHDYPIEVTRTAPNRSDRMIRRAKGRAPSFCGDGLRLEGRFSRGQERLQLFPFQNRVCKHALVKIYFIVIFIIITILL